jgi:CheY-like chemotaxis protein
MEKRLSEQAALVAVFDAATAPQAPSTGRAAMTGLDKYRGLGRPPDRTGVDPLRGASILIAEDNPYIASALEEMMIEQGILVIGLARTVKEALKLCEAPKIDLALLDVNLGDEKIDPVAERLAARLTPFVFATAYGRSGVPEAFRNSPIVEKPFLIEEMLRTLRGALTQAVA